MEFFQTRINLDGDDKIIELNVGGKIFSTLKSTLSRENDSLLDEMINGKIATKVDNSGRYFIDCDPDIFCHILEYLRFGKYPLPEKVIDVYDYARIFRLGKFMASLEQFKDVQYKLQGDHSKSSLDDGKYKQLLQDIVGKLSILNEYANPRRYICIITVPNISDYLPECKCDKLYIGNINGINHQASAIKPHIKTELQNTDNNLVRALALDLKSLGYGRLSYIKRVCSGCQGCAGYSRRQIAIMLNSKNTEKSLELGLTNWILI